MGTYWDMSEKARAALTRDEVAAFVDFELMVAGVLKPKPLALVEIAELGLPTRSFYKIVADYPNPAPDVLFNSEADARAFIAMKPSQIHRDYQLGNIEFAQPLSDDPRIEVVSIAMKADAALARARLNERKAAENENEKRQREFDEQTRAANDASKGLWEDWRECQSKGVQMRRVAEVFADYVKTAGSPQVAAKFLSKAFPITTIDEAQEWTGTVMRFAYEPTTIEATS